MDTKLFLIFDALYIVILIFCAVIDAKRREIPHVGIAGILVLVIVKFIVCCSSQNYQIFWSFLTLLLCVPFFICWRKGMMGAGDIKLIALGGLFQGILEILIVLFIAFFVMMLKARRGRTVRLPFAVYFAPAAAVVVAAGWILAGLS